MKIFTVAVLYGMLLIVLPPTRVDAQRTGVEIWAQTCGNCHVTQPAARYTAERWTTIMTHMKIYARLTEAEAEATLQFLQGGAQRLIVAAHTMTNDAPVLIATSDNTSLGDLLLIPDPNADFKSYCAACHGPKGKGNGPAAVALDPRPADLTKTAFQEARTDSALASAITNGKGMMPSFEGQLTSEQIHALTAYIRSLAKN